MQNEDDLRGLAKVTDFMRAISFLFLTIHIYWFCYGWLYEMGWTLDIVNKILSNFQRTTGLFSSLLYTKLFLCPFPRSVLHGQQRSEETWNHMKANYHCGHIRHPVVFLQLVAAVRQCFIRCLCRALYHDTDRRFLLSAGVRFMNKPFAQKQSAWRRF